MASVGYSRSAYSTRLAGNSALSQVSEDYTPTYNAYQNIQQQPFDGVPDRSCVGRRQLDWGPGPGCSSGHRQSFRLGTAVEDGHTDAAASLVGNTASGFEGCLNHNHVHATTRADDADCTYTSKNSLQRRAAGAAMAAAPAQPAVVLGREIAGYKSVVTKNPVSPSGYSLAAPKQQQQKQQQQPAASTAGSPDQQHSTFVSGRGVPLYHPSQQAPAQVDASDRLTLSTRSAAAAAAALAALNNNRARSAQGQVKTTAGSISSSTGPHSTVGADPATPNFNGASNGSWDSYCMVGDQGFSYQQMPALPEAPNMLQWKLPVRAQAASAGSASGTSAAGHIPTVGRRAVAAASTSMYSTTTSNEETSCGYVPSSATGLRPPSQQRSEGLSKLKQLASARLVSRITTPPTSEVAAAATAAPATSNRPGLGRSSSSNRRGAVAKAVGKEQQQQQWPENRVQVAGDYDPSNYTNHQYLPSTSRRGLSGSLQAVAHIKRATAPNIQQQQQSIGPPSVTKGFIGGDTGTASAAAAQDSSHWQPAAGEACHECPSCGRKFVATALEKHVRICEKVFGQKRKAFNMQSQRLQHTEAEKFVAKGGNSSNAASRGAAAASWGSQQQQQQGAAGKALSSKQLDSRPAVSAAAAKKSKWQQQSEQLRKAMRAAQAGGSSSGVGRGGGSGGGYGRGPIAPAYEEQDDRVPCPHCGRRFAELVAERHIPKCSEIIAKPKGLKAGGGKGAYMRSNSRNGR